MAIPYHITQIVYMSRVKTWEHVCIIKMIRLQSSCILQGARGKGGGGEAEDIFYSGKIF